MYIPGSKYILLVFILLILLFLTALVKNLAPLLPLISAVAFYIAVKWGRRLLYLGFEPERFSAIVSPESIQVFRDFVEFVQGCERILECYLQVVDIDIEENVLNVAEDAMRVVNSLHTVLKPTIFIINIDGLKYYIRLRYCETANLDVKTVRKSFATMAGNLMRTLLNYGVETRLVDPKTVFEQLGVKIGETKIGFKPPRVLAFSLALTFITVVLSFLNPVFIVLSAFFTGLVCLSFNHLPMFKPGTAKLLYNFVDKRIFEVKPIQRIVPDKSRAGANVLNFRTVLAGEESPYTLIADLEPVDPSQLSAELQWALEVLESGRAGVSKLVDEFKAGEKLALSKALERGELPFKLRLFLVIGEEGAPIYQRVKTLGYSCINITDAEFLGREVKAPELKFADFLSVLYGTNRRKLYFEALEDRINKVGVKGLEMVTSQLVQYTPYAFFKPGTEKTPKAVYLGYGLRRDERVYLEIDKLTNVHGFIVGPPGSGKSTGVRTIQLRAIRKGITTIVVDPSGEYRGFIESIGGRVIDLMDYPFNLLDFEVTGFQTGLREFQKAMMYVAPLSDEEMYVIAKILEKKECSLDELIYYLEARGYTSTVAKLRWIQPYFSPKNGYVDVRRLMELRKPIALCLGSIEPGEYVNMPIDIMRFAFHMLLNQIVAVIRRMGLGDVRYLLVVDEGHLFMFNPPGMAEPALTTVSRIYRKFGLATVVLTHLWGDLDPKFRQNAGWRLALASSDPDYLTYTRTYMTLNDTEYKWLKDGIIGRGVLRQVHSRHNYLVNIEAEPIALTSYWWEKPPRVKEYYKVGVQP